MTRWFTKPIAVLAALFLGTLLAIILALVQVVPGKPEQMPAAQALFSVNQARN